MPTVAPNRVSGQRRGAGGNRRVSDEGGATTAIDPPRALYLLGNYSVRYNMTDWLAAALVFTGHPVPFDATDMSKSLWGVLRMLVSSGEKSGTRIAEGEFYANDMAVAHLTSKGEEYMHLRTPAAQLVYWSKIASKILTLSRIDSM